MAEKFIPKFVDQLRARRMGDPLARETQIGPQARVELRDDLHRQVEESIKRGAQRLLGGEIPRGNGAFYPATVLAAVDKGMPAFDEETFGPVAAVIRAKDETDAVRLANDSQFGLGAALWTRDHARGRASGGPPRSGRRVRQRHGEVRSAAAVRRHQEVGVRTRALGVRHPRVRQHQDGLDGVTGVMA